MCVLEILSLLLWTNVLKQTEGQCNYCKIYPVTFNLYTTVPKVHQFGVLTGLLYELKVGQYFTRSQTKWNAASPSTQLN